MTASIVTTDEELLQIVELSQINMRKNISAAEQAAQGFITWNYSFDLIKQMNAQSPHVIVKNNNAVVGYALVALKEAGIFHPDLKAMIDQLEKIIYHNKPLAACRYYVMGQVCVEKAYRGKGVFEMLYRHHKELMQPAFDFVVTEISAGNTRSLQAHAKIGFKNIHSYRDALDEWNVVLWNWQ